jgi:hypothetical protein
MSFHFLQDIRFISLKGTTETASQPAKGAYGKLSIPNKPRCISGFVQASADYIL